jgi:hypothetical protein
MHFRNWVVVLAVTVAALGWPATGAGQSTERSGIEGKVVDQGGGVLPGVTVTIASDSLQGGARSTVTDSEGKYRFSALPSGTFLTTFELSGFTTTKRDVRLDAGFVATIDQTMGVGGVEQNVTVTAESPVVDIRTTSVSTNLGREALENLPTSRSMWQVMNLAPGLRVSGSDVGGSGVGTQQSYSNYGTSTGGNKPTIDGVDTREDASGAGFYYDYGAFQEVQIKAMGNDAEMSVPGTMFVGVLKSGGDSFHGSGMYAWESKDLQRSNLTDAMKARGVTAGNSLQHYHDANVDLGGPIFKQRLWFYSSFRHQKIRQGVVGYIAEAGSDGTYGTADDVPGYYRVTLTNTTVKLSGQATPKHRFSAFTQIQEKEMPQRGGDSYRHKDATFNQDFKPMIGKAEWSWMASDRTYANIFVGRWMYNTEQSGNSEQATSYDTVTLAYWGIYNTMPLNIGRGRWQYNANVSHYMPNTWGGTHDLKAGIEVTDEGRYGNAASRPYQRDYQLQYQSGVPYRVLLRSAPFDTKNKMRTVSAFARDAWRVGEGLTFNVGARYERYHVYLPEQTREAGRFFAGGTYAETDVVTWNAWAPRAGLSWALDSKNRTVAKLTYGWFNFATQATYGDSYNFNALSTETYKWSDLNGNRDYDDGELGTFVTSTGMLSGAINPDLKQPKTHEVTASLEHQIASNFSTRLSYVYRRETDRYQNTNVLRPYEAYSIGTTTTDPGPDGTLGTSDDGGAVTYYDYTAAYAGSSFVKNMDINTDGYTNRYHTVELAAQKRMSNRWQLVASAMGTHLDTWRNGIPQDPNAENFYPKSQYWEWVVKLSGSYQLPWRVQAAAMFTSQSGDTWAREVRFTTGLTRLGSLTVLVEDPAARRLPTQNIANIRLEKRQKIGPGTASFQLDVFNMFNTNVELGVTARSGASFNNITSFVPPMVARVGASYSF